MRAGLLALTARVKTNGGPAWAQLRDMMTLGELGSLGEKAGDTLESRPGKLARLVLLAAEDHALSNLYLRLLDSLQRSLREPHFAVLMEYPHKVFLSPFSSLVIDIGQ